jgi:para-nitrobenzyl esterase
MPPPNPFKLTWIIFKHGSEAIFDRSMLPKKGVVQVTVNYRLGIFGNLALPELSAEDEHHSSGNDAELDNLAARVV